MYLENVHSILYCCIEWFRIGRKLNSLSALSSQSCSVVCRRNRSGSDEAGNMHRMLDWIKDPIVPPSHKQSFVAYNPHAVQFCVQSQTCLGHGHRPVHSRVAP
ncbi:hypothetical protein BaRGS_00001796 [Batillaria attramentaria]|uniref:Uncharacterized protein n=1 Tax=Batillaria attramentaria TaxID=370345 RepID=A0ABD0M4T6_9CAEN